MADGSLQVLALVQAIKAPVQAHLHLQEVIAQALHREAVVADLVQVLQEAVDANSEELLNKL